MELLTQILTITLLMISFTQRAMEAQKELVVYAIPGQSGLGTNSTYVKQIIEQNTDVIHVKTPSFLMDLGQRFCQSHLDDAIKTTNKQGIIHATSQGTATALNYIASCKNDTPINGLILEAVLASGNSAIYHTVTGPLMNMNWLENIPGSYYILPYLASVTACFGYRPAGQQAIHSVDHISTDLPIIIIHSKEDIQLPFDGALALYYRLRTNGNKNVYLIPEQGMDHIEILYNSTENQNAVNKILKKHLENSSEQNDFSEYQPAPEQYKSFYDKLIAKENNHRSVERFLSIGGGLAGIMGILAMLWQQ